jgi:hypothetical protein
MWKEIKRFAFSIRYPILLIAFIWIVEIVDRIFRLEFENFGILPRTAEFIIIPFRY